MNNLGTGNELETNDNENLSTAIKSIFVNGYSNASREFERFCTFWGFIDRPRNNMNGFTFRESGYIPLDQSTSTSTNDDVNQINQQNSFTFSRSYNNNHLFQQTNNKDNGNSEGTIYERVIPDTHRYQGRQQKRSTSSLLEQDINMNIASSSSSSSNNNNNNDHSIKRTRYTSDSYSNNLSTKKDDNNNNNNEDTGLYLNSNNRKRPLEIDTIENDDNNNGSFSDQNSSSRYKKLKLTESLDTDGNTTLYSNIQSLTNRNISPILSSSLLPFNEDTATAKHDGYDHDHDRLRKDRQDKLSTFSSIHSTPLTIHASPTLQDKHIPRQYNFNSNGGGRRVSTSSSLMTSSSTSHLLFLEDERLARLEQEVHTLQSQVHKFKDSPFLLQQQLDHYSSLKKGKDINHSTQPSSSLTSLTKSSKYQWPPSTDSGKTQIKTNANRHLTDTAVTPTHPVNISKQPQLPHQKTVISTPLHTSPSKDAVHIPKTSPIKKRASLFTTNDEDNDNHDNHDSSKKQALPEKKQVISSPPSMYRTPNPINFTPSRMTAAATTTTFVQKTPLPTLNIIPSSSSPTSTSSAIKSISPLSPTPSSSSSSTTTTTTSFVINQPRHKLDLNEIRNHRLVQKKKSTAKESTSTSTSIDEKVASHRQLPVSNPILSSTPSNSTLKRINFDEKHKDTMNKIIHQIPEVKLRKTDMIRGPDGNMYRNPIWHEIYKNGK